MKLVNVSTGEILCPLDRPRIQRLKPNPKGNKPFGTLVGVAGDGMLMVEFDGRNIIKVSAMHYGLELMPREDWSDDT